MDIDTTLQTIWAWGHSANHDCQSRGHILESLMRQQEQRCPTVLCSCQEQRHEMHAARRLCSIFFQEHALESRRQSTSNCNTDEIGMQGREPVGSRVIPIPIEELLHAQRSESTSKRKDETTELKRKTVGGDPETRDQRGRPALGLALWALGLWARCRGWWLVRVAAQPFWQEAPRLGCPVMWKKCLPDHKHPKCLKYLTRHGNKACFSQLSFYRFDFLGRARDCCIYVAPFSLEPMGKEELPERPLCFAEFRLYSRLRTNSSTRHCIAHGSPLHASFCSVRRWFWRWVEAAGFAGSTVNW